MKGQVRRSWLIARCTVQRVRDNRVPRLPGSQFSDCAPRQGALGSRLQAPRRAGEIFDDSFKSVDEFGPVWTFRNSTSPACMHLLHTETDTHTYIQTSDPAGSPPKPPWIKDHACRATDSVAASAPSSASEKHANEITVAVTQIFEHWPRFCRSAGDEF